MKQSSGGAPLPRRRRALGESIAALEFRVLEVGQLRELLGRWLDRAERLAVPGAGGQLEALLEETRRALG